MGADVDRVVLGMGLDPRIGSQFLRAGIGFGGACFPKDTIGILGIAKKLDVDMSALDAIWKKNLKIRKNRDWESMPQAFKKTK